MEKLLGGPMWAGGPNVGRFFISTHKMSIIDTASLAVLRILTFSSLHSLLYRKGLGDSMMALKSIASS